MAAVTAASIQLIAGVALAQPALYTQNFDVDDAANWVVNDNEIGTNEVNVYFDYGPLGIPPAPHSQGTTRGLKLSANLDPANPSDGLDPAISISPINKAFVGDYVLTFDWWQNYIGPLPTGAVGSTMLSTFGIMTPDTASNYPGAVDGVFFAATGDGGSAFDYRAYSRERATSYQFPVLDEIDTHANYHAGSRDHSAALYQATFPGGDAAPAAQQSMYPTTQTGTTPSGSAGFAWHQVAIAKTANLIIWKVNGVPLVTLDAGAFTIQTYGENIVFGHADTNNTTSHEDHFPLVQFTLIDNVQVRSLAGDYDADGDVDLADYSSWQASYGTNNPLADGNQNGQVDAADYTLWRNTLGAGAFESAQANGQGMVDSIPEPGSLFLVLGALAAAAVNCESRRNRIARRLSLQR